MQWEYLIEPVLAKPIDKERDYLQVRGCGGWELTAIQQRAGLYFYYFKRPLRE